MKVCILSTKCSKWKAALNSTLSVNLRWVWWKHSRCIFFPGITCFVNTFHGSFKSWICFNKFQPPKKRWSSTICGQKKHKQRKNNTRQSPQLDFCAPGVAPFDFCIFSPMAEERGFCGVTVSFDFCFWSQFSRWNHPNTNKMSSGKLCDFLVGESRFIVTSYPPLGMLKTHNFERRNCPFSSWRIPMGTMASWKWVC